MATSTAPTRCLLCNDVITDGDVRQHLRVVHEVMVGERTHVDVPVGAAPAPRPIKAGPRTGEKEKLAAIV